MINITSAHRLLPPVAWFGLAMIAMVWFGIWYQIHSDYGRAEQSAQRHLQNYSRVFEEHIIRTVRELDKALLIARRRYLEALQSLPYEDAIGLRLPDPTLLSDMSFQLAVIDRDGKMAATTIGEPPPTAIDLNDREHFQIHKSTRPDIPFISKPVFGRQSKRWSLQLTRRIEGPGGTFDGVLVASMDPAHFGRFYGSIDFGKEDAVILAGLDGIVRVSNGSKVLKLGDKIENGELMNAAASGNGFYKGDMDGSGSEHLFALRHMDGQPLFVAVGTTPSSVFAAVENNRNRYIIAGAVVTFLILLAVIASIRHHLTIARMARFDDLTGLANRASFREALQAAESDIQRGRKVGIFLLDIDNFKAANDSYGHVFGDKILEAVGNRLLRITRSGDVLARLAGDEFAILLKDFRRDGLLSVRAEEILEFIRRPIIIDGRRLRITVSIGSAIASTTECTAERLSKNADLALYEAKRRGRNCHRIFQQEMAERFAERRRLEEDLTQALEAGQLELFYQPVHSLAGDNISGFEALLRWNHPDRGWIAPADFIPIAEESRLIIPIGDWVLNEACMRAQEFAPDKQIAVNLSPVQFQDPLLFERIVAALDNSQLQPNRLELEITESLMMEAEPATIHILRRIRALGVRIAMDDFGTGYSSLGYLCSFEFDRIKIDRSFIIGLEQHGNYAAVIRMIVSLAKSLGVSTTAEGVETLQQFEMIRAMGCTEVQGYLFSPPKPLEQIRYLTNPREALRPQPVQIGAVSAQREEAKDFTSAQSKPAKAALRDAAG